MFEVGKKAIDRVSLRRSIEATAQPNNRVPTLSFNGVDAIDALVVTWRKTRISSGGSWSRVRPVSAGANTSNSSRNSKERCSSNANVSVSTTLKNESTEGYLAGSLGSFHLSVHPALRYGNRSMTPSVSAISRPQENEHECKHYCANIKSSTGCLSRRF